MDGSSTLVLEGQTDTFPSVNVSDSATVDGNLVLHVTLPSTFNSYGQWQNYTIMTCRKQCGGEFQSVVIESDSPCSTIESYQPFSDDKAFHLSILFKHESCFAAVIFPPLIYISVFLLFLCVQ